MTEPTRSAPTPIGDVVPGEPPVPITVWDVRAPQPGETMSNGLGARLVHNFTYLGDLIIDLTCGPQLARSIIASGRRSRTERPATLAFSAEPAALIVTGWPIGDIEPGQFFARCLPRLRPSGCIAVVLDHTEPTVQADLIVAARHATLAYLQHIVAATGLTVRSSRLDADGRHLRVHTDVLILTRSVDVPSGADG